MDKLTVEQKAEILRRALAREPFADISRTMGIPRIVISKFVFSELWHGRIALS